MSTSPTDQTSQPISIDSNTNNAHNTGRKRSASVWSNPGLSPSGSPVSSTMSLQTPASSFSGRGQGSPTSPTSPLSFFLGSSSPIKSSSVFVGGSQKGSSLLDGCAVEDEEAGARTKLGHARAGSTNWPSSGHDRAAGVMRRLSLGGALGGVRPVIQQHSPPRVPSPPQGLRRDSNETVHAMDRAPSPHLRPKKNGSTKKRSVSPMGERILKGHFDGFGL